MALDGIDKLVAILSGGLMVSISKASVASMAAGNLASLWRATGAPAQGAGPSSFVTCTNALAGAIALPSLGSLRGYVGRLALAGANPGTFILCDRLAHMGGLLGTVITAQSVNVDLIAASAAGRCQPDGSDVDWFVEIYADLGGTAVNATVNYNDASDAAQNAPAVALASVARASRLYQILPNAGTSIKKVNSVTLSASTGSSGNFGVTARRRMASIGQPLANVAPPSDFAVVGAPEFQASSCLELLVLCTTTTTGAVMGEIVLGVA